MPPSANQTEEKKTWAYAFIILAAVSAWILGTRLTGGAFLAFEFELLLVYLPTVLAGIIASYLNLKKA